jgi:hypothetical protein
VAVRTPGEPDEAFVGPPLEGLVPRQVQQVADGVARGPQLERDHERGPYSPIGPLAVGPTRLGPVITELPDAPSVVAPPPGAGPDHPMRQVTRQVAFEGGWSPGRAAKVAELFDSLAPTWDADHDGTARRAVLADALDRAGLPSGRCLELGSGTGLGTRALGARFELVVAVDLSAGMLRRAPAGVGARVLADSAWLPLRGASVDAVVLVNMLLFPAEVARVLAPDGVVLWANTLGDRTPIHLPPDDVLAALPGDWTGVTARAGSGFWLAARRDS